MDSFGILKVTFNSLILKLITFQKVL